MQEYQPIERDDNYERDYIPLPGGWEIQTKGKGSTFRLCDPKGDRLAIPDSPYLFEDLTEMAKDANVEWKKLVDEIAALKAEVETLRKDAARWKIVRDGAIMSDNRPAITFNVYEDGKFIGRMPLMGRQAEEKVDQYIK